MAVGSFKKIFPWSYINISSISDFVVLKIKRYFQVKYVILEAMINVENIFFKRHEVMNCKIKRKCKISYSIFTKV